MSKALHEAVGALIRAADLSSAQEAVRTLEQSHSCQWRAVGDREGNYGNINIGSDPGHAFVERVTNAIDGVIEREAARQMRPTKKGKAAVPASPREAVEAWFGVPGGRVANLEARTKKGKLVEGPSRQVLADNVVVRVLDGQRRKAPTLEVRDLGIGLTATQIPKTILSLNEQNKIDKPYLAGAFGQGGSTALAFSPAGCLIVSRRQPDLLPPGENDQIAATFVRFNELDPETNKNGRYEYLTLPNGNVPTVPATKFQEFDAGTRVVHFEMEIPQYSQRLTQLTGSLWWLLQNSLFDPVLPIWAEERRKDMLVSKQEGVKDKEKDRRTIAGNYTRLMDGCHGSNDELSAIEHNDSADVDLQVDGQVRVNYWVVRYRPEDKGNPITSYVDEHKPITFTFNGQSHGYEDRRFTTDRLSLPHLAKSLIIQVELDGITANARRQILSTTRDRLKQLGLYQEIRERIAGVLGEDRDLDRLNRERKEQLLTKHSAADRTKMQERFAKLMDRFRAGVDAKGGRNGPNEGRGEPENTTGGGREKLPPLKTRDDPTFIRVANTQKPIPVRLDRHALIRLESDAPDGYLNGHVHARITVAADPEGTVAMDSRTDFRGGRARLTIRAHEAAKAGKKATLTIFLLTAKGTTLATKVTLRFEAPAEPEETSGKGERPNVKVPAPIEVYKDDWAKHGWDEHSVVRVDEDEQGTLVFVNMDNEHFVRFLKASSYQEVGLNRMKNNFLLYVAFYAWMKAVGDRGGDSRRVEIQPRCETIVTLDSNRTVTWSWKRYFLPVHLVFGTVAAMDNVARAADMLKRVGRMVEGFLVDLTQTAPNDLDCLALERSVMTTVLELGLSMMKEVFRRADEQAPEVVVHGSRWGNRAVSKGTYSTKFGTFTLDRSGYQQSGRGRVLFPLDLRLGIVEGRYTPGMARLMAQTIAQMPAEDGEAYLEELGLGLVSKSTLHRIPQDMAALHERDRVAIEAVICGESRVPEGTHTVQVGMDGVMVPMDGEDIKPRGRKTTTPQLPRHERHHGVAAPSPADDDGKKGVAYHEASVGTLSFFDAEGEHLGTVYAARMPEYRKETLSATLEAELSAAIQDCPTVQVAFASDGAVTHWEHLAGMQGRLPEGICSRQLLDFCHGAKYLFDAAKLVEPDEGKAMAMAEGWRAALRHRLDGPDIVIRALRYQRDACESEDGREALDTIIDYFVEHKRQGRLAYKAAANDAFPIGTGTTEAAAKTVVNIRMKRAGARYTPHGGQTILCFRAALLSGRFDITMREIIKRYSAEVKAA